VPLLISMSRSAGLPEGTRMVDGLRQSSPDVGPVPPVVLLPSPPPTVPLPSSPPVVLLPPPVPASSVHASEGIEVIMATGDAKGTAEAVAARLKLQRVHASMSPEDKHELVLALKREGRKVAFAGDGVNDAPALAAADVGIAMGTGADVAIESAGITLLKGDLSGIVRARKLAHATLRNIKQNLWFAFGYNALGVPVAAGVLFPVLGWLLSPMIAAAAMAFSSVSVIGNALRLNGEKL
jgi:Cu+-exporting ATPase